MDYKNLNNYSYITAAIFHIVYELKAKNIVLLYSLKSLETRGSGASFMTKFPSLWKASVL